MTPELTDFYQHCVAFCERHGVPKDCIRIYSVQPCHRPIHQQHQNQVDRYREIRFDGQRWLAWRENGYREPTCFARVEFESEDEAKLYGFEGTFQLIGLRKGRPIQTEFKRDKIQEFLDKFMKDFTPLLPPGVDMEIKKGAFPYLSPTLTT